MVASAAFLGSPKRPKAEAVDPEVAAAVLAAVAATGAFSLPPVLIPFAGRKDVEKFGNEPACAPVLMGDAAVAPESTGVPEDAIVDDGKLNGPPDNGFCAAPNTD